MPTPASCLGVLGVKEKKYTVQVTSLDGYISEPMVSMFINLTSKRVGRCMEARLIMVIRYLSTTTSLNQTKQLSPERKK